MDRPPPIAVGIAGLGRSGVNIHARLLQQLPAEFRIAAVMDVEEARRREVQVMLECRSHRTFDELVADPEVELVIDASPNSLHAAHAVRAMRSGKHVVCEKPMALSSADARRMIQVAEETCRLLIPFQNRRYEPHFQKVMEIVASGILGRIVQIRLCWHGFSRRWDWQTLRSQGGGLLNNLAPHLLDHALELFGPADPEIFVDAQHAISCGDAEDHVKIVLKRDGAPTIDIELSSVCAFPQDRWLVLGTAGGLAGTTRHLRWKWLDWSTMPERMVEQVPTPDRSFNSEQLAWFEEAWQDDSDDAAAWLLFYRDTYSALREGSPHRVTAASVCRQIGVIERCRELTPAFG